MVRYILLAILALLLLLLFAPVKVEAVFRGNVLSLRLRLLWVLPIRILPAREKPPGKEKPPKKKKKPKKPKEKKPEKERAPSEKAPQKGPVEKVLDLLELVNDLLPHLVGSAGYILRRLTLSRCRVGLIVGGGEADEVGISCGKAYAVGYAAQSGLRGAGVRIKEFYFNVLPDFISEQSAADVEVTLALRPSTLLAGGLLLLLRLGKTLLKRRK